MKKTVIVNINGIIFHIDEDAYGTLNAYLDALHRYFDSQTEGKEIVSDIESRIAELLQPLITDIKQSITIDDIEGIIATLGKPEDIAGEESPMEEEVKEPKGSQDSSRHNSRRLYRDPDNSIISGVSSGIAAYFDIDPVLIRILFVALIFAGGVSFIIYPILWIVLPQAQTAAQKLEMRGENVTINNIERTYHTTDRVDPNSFWGRTRSMINELFGLFGKVFYAIWRIFSFVLGLFLILISLTMIISLIAATFFNKFYVDAIASNSTISIKELFNMVINPGETSLLLFVLLIVILIPLIGLIYAGLKLIIRFKVKDKWAVLSMFLLWIASIIVATVLVFSQVNNFRLSGNIKEIVTLSTPKDNILCLNMPYLLENEEKYHMRVPPHGLFGITLKDNKKNLWGITRIDIEKSTKTFPELEIIREARGISIDEAKEAAKQIKINYNQSDSTINIDPTFWLNQGKWKFQTTQIIIHLPVGMKIYLNPNTRHFLDNIQNTNNIWDFDMVDKTWEMTENGLKLISNSKVDTFELKPIQNHILYLQKRDRFSISEHQINYHEFGSIEKDGKTYNFRAINLDIRKSENNSIKLDVDKKTAWTSKYNANAINQDITYSFEQKDSVLWLDPVFLFPQTMKRNDQEVNLILYLPIDFKIFFSSEMRPFIGRYAERNNKNEDDYLNSTWKMTFDGLYEILEKKDAND